VSRPPLAYLYCGFALTVCGAGSWWGWSNAWDNGTRCAAVVAGLGCLGTLLALGDLLFPAPTKKFTVFVEVPDGPLELPCYTYEQAFHVALYAQLLAFEKHGIWLAVSISPDQPEKVKL
jgi:hypothetical protein